MNTEKQQKALEIYSVLRAANARLVGFDDPEHYYFGTGAAQEHMDRHMERPEFKRAYDMGEEHHSVFAQKTVFVEKLSLRNERTEDQPKDLATQRIKL